MKIITTQDYDEMSQKAARIFIQQVKEKPNSVLGFAAGSTVFGMYRELVKAYKNNEADFSKVTSFNLDEYYPIAPDNDQSYHYFMREKLFKRLNIPFQKINIPDGQAEDIEKFCAEYEKKIKKVGGIDLQVLGLGRNGHIAFNEPGSSFNSRTRLVDLAEDTLVANSRFFADISEVPRKAITMGLATIMECKKILILASGQDKAEAVAKSAEGLAAEDVPASVLQKHPDAFFIIDEAAGARLKP